MPLIEQFPTFIYLFANNNNDNHSENDGVIIISNDKNNNNSLNKDNYNKRKNPPKGLLCYQL